MAQTPAPETPAFVLDYTTVTCSGSTCNGYRFAPNETFFISNPIRIDNDAVFCGGTVIKLAPNLPGSSITINGTAHFETGPGRMVIITARDDDSVGQAVQGSTGTPGGVAYGQPALEFSYNAAPVTIDYLRVSWALQAIYFQNGSGTLNKIRHSQILNGYSGVCLDNNLTAHNVLFSSVDTPFEGYFFNIHGEHVTVHRAFMLASDWLEDGAQLTLINSIIVEAGACTPMTCSTPAPTVWLPPEDYPFQTSVLGAYYLADDSIYRGIGNSAIDTELRQALQQKTTWPPVVLPGGSLVSLTLDPRVPRNTGINPDLGFSYDPLDYVARGFYMEQGSGALLLTNGVVVGVDAAANSTGIRVAAGVELISQGNPVQMNRFIEVRSIQEQYSGSVSFFTTIEQEFANSSPSHLRLKFTEFVGRAGLDWHIHRLNGLGSIALTDCQLFGGGIGGPLTWSLEHTIGLTNNLFDHSKVSIVGVGQTHFDAFNNTFTNSQISLSSGNYSWNVRDNVFLACSLGASPPVGSSHNGYWQTYPLADTGPNHALTAQPNYVLGPLGNWYLQEGSSQLRNGGSRSPATARLYHHTTRVDQSHEGAKPAGFMVDLGFHYPALNSSNLPLDSDGDGISNLAEDVDADAVKDPSETDFADADTDYDGRSDGEELLERTDPLNPGDGKPVQLGYWRFDETTWQGEEGQLPLSANGVEAKSSWAGTAEEINATTGGSLTYRSVELYGSGNINCRNGTIRFWLKPNWFSIPELTGWGRLIEVGNASSPAEGWWALSINHATGALLFESRLDSSTVTYLNIPVSWSAKWCQIVLTYSSTATKIYINGQLLGTGPGIQHFPTKAARVAYGFSIGSNRSGSDLAFSKFDELETFNFPLTPEAILEQHQSVATPDYDRDGLTDIAENEQGTDPHNLDTDADGLLDGPEVATHQTNPLDADTDYDGRSDGQELNEFTTPTNPSSFALANLATFNFNLPDLAGTRDQKPTEILNVVQPSSWSFNSALLAGPNPSKLRYASYEADGTASVNCRQATIRLWFKPNWSSGPGAGPGHQASLFDTGNLEEDGFGLFINPDGTILGFYRWGNFALCEVPINFAAGQWVHITLTFNPGSTCIYLNGALAACDWGYGELLSISALKGGFSIGTNPNGSEPAEGELEDFSTFNYVLSSSEVAADHQNYVDINRHSVNVPAVLNGSSAFVQVSAGPGSTMAYLLNTQDFANAVWGPPNSFTVEGLLEGENVLWIGFRNAGGETIWIEHRIVRDLTPPQIVITKPVITDPVATIVRIPMIQLHGYATKELSKLTFSVENAAGIFSDGLTSVRAPVIDPATQILQVPFHCLDIALTPGNNRIFVHAWDRAGNEAVLEVVYALDFSGVTQGPAILSQWPVDGAYLSGSAFTLRGFVDDPTASIQVTIVGGTATTEREAVIERDGLFWIENLPLNSGANQVTVSLRNAAGFETVSSFTVYQSTVQITFDSVPPSMLYNHTITLTGTISDELNYTLWVNGVRAMMSGNNTWVAQKVPLNEGGTATFQAIAIPNTANNGNGTPAPAGTPLNNATSPNPSAPGATAATQDPEKPRAFVVRSYTHSSSSTCSGCPDPCDPDEGFGYTVISESSNWEHQKGGKFTRTTTSHWCEYKPEPDPPVNRTTILDYEAEWDPDDHCRSRYRLDGGEWSEWEDPGYLGCQPVPKWPWVHVKYSKDTPYDGYAFQSTYNADTKVELHTGGKGVSGKKAIFTLSASIGSHAYLTYPDQTWPAKVKIGELGETGSDGLLYKVLADNQIYNVSVEAPPNAYEFSVNATKHVFHIAANGYDLPYPSMPPHKEFCVGEKVSLVSYFDPPLINLVNGQPRESYWGVEGTFINKIVKRKEPKSPLYEVDPTLLFQANVFQPSTRVWWYDKGENYVTAIWRGLKFLNGQEIGSFGEARRLEIYRPTLSGFGFGSPRSFMRITTAANPDNNGFWYGDDENQINNMKWWVTLNSKYEGAMSITQLINADYRKKSWGEWGLVAVTDGLEADGGEFAWMGYYRHNQPASATYKFDDAPGIHFSSSFITGASVSATFVDYIRFKPGSVASDNIDVTLGVVPWNCQGKWTSSDGITINVTPAPGPLQDSTSFPTWDSHF